MDVDDPADLHALLAYAPIPGATGAWLADARIAERLTAG